MSEVSRENGGKLKIYLQLILSTQVVRRQKDWAFPVSEIITAVREFDFSPYVVPIYEVEGLKHWHTSRMVLIGDAAHGELAS